jgi:hypothetical protein
LLKLPDADVDAAGFLVWVAFVFTGVGMRTLRQSESIQEGRRGDNEVRAFGSVLFGAALLAGLGGCAGMSAKDNARF